jgi:hypothetical protein
VSANLSTLPKEWQGVNACAEIKMHPSGRFLYVSNRGHDSIAGFTLDDEGKMTALGWTPTEKSPRSFDIDPSGQFLYAAGESSGKLATYQIDSKNGALKLVKKWHKEPRTTSSHGVPATKQYQNVRQCGTILDRIHTIQDAGIIQVGLTALVDSQGGLPVFSQCLDGQRNGRRAILEQFQLLQQHLPLPTGLLMISDRGTYSADHVRRLHCHGFYGCAPCLVCGESFRNPVGSGHARRAA